MRGFGTFELFYKQSYRIRTYVYGSIRYCIFLVICESFFHIFLFLYSFDTMII